MATQPDPDPDRISPPFPPETPAPQPEPTRPTTPEEAPTIPPDIDEPGFGPDEQPTLP